MSNHAVIVPGEKASNMTQMAAACLVILGARCSSIAAGFNPQNVTSWSKNGIPLQVNNFRKDSDLFLEKEKLNNT